MEIQVGPFSGFRRERFVHHPCYYDFGRRFDMDHTLPNRVLVLGGVPSLRRCCASCGRRPTSGPILTRDYAHYGPALKGPRFRRDLPNPCSWLRQEPPGPTLRSMSPQWALRPWTAEFLTLGLPLLCPSTGEGCASSGNGSPGPSVNASEFPFPALRFVKTRAEAEALVRDSQRAFVSRIALLSDQPHPYGRV